MAPRKGARSPRSVAAMCPECVPHVGPLHQKHRCPTPGHANHGQIGERRTSGTWATLEPALVTCSVAFGRRHLRTRCLQAPLSHGGATRDRTKEEATEEKAQRRGSSRQRREGDTQSQTMGERRREGMQRCLFDQSPHWNPTHDGHHASNCLHGSRALYP